MDTAQAFRHNLADAVRLFAHYGGARLDESRDHLFAAAPHAFPAPLLNAALRTNPQADAKEVVEDAKRFFDALNRRFVLWATSDSDRDLAAAAQVGGLRELRSSPAGPIMAMTTPPDAVSIPQLLSLRVVRSRTEARTFARIAGHAFAAPYQPPSVARALFSDPGLFRAEEAIGVLAYLGEEPASCALVVIRSGTAGLFYVGTRKPLRGRGIAQAISQEAARIAFEEDASCVVLSAARRAVPLYSRVGFLTIANCGLYVQTSTIRSDA